MLLRSTPLALLLLAACGPSGTSNQPAEVACTQEAKLCPDGSAVGRTGPDCEFAPCPGEGQSPPAGEPKMCTMEAKLCPDGSSVGRTGPNCEFAPCPGNK